MSKFYCIILKGTDTPNHSNSNPLLSDFEFQIPLHDKQDDLIDEAVLSTRKLEESFVRESLRYDLLEDTMPEKARSSSQVQALAAQSLAVNRALLQMLANEVNGGDEHGMKALEIVHLLKDDQSGKMVEAAKKIVQRKQLDVLENKIIALQEHRADLF